MNKITNINVWGLGESIIASGYPMQHGSTPNHENRIIAENDIKRAGKLGNAKGGSGHDNYLKGIIVQFDWQISQVIFPQVERYHFIDIVSSQSKMHRLQLAVKDDFNVYVDSMILNRFMELVQTYNHMDDSKDHVDKQKMFLTIAYSVPMGYELTARFTTNYLQLKTIYHQRKNHKLPEWKEFCKWVETLPKFKQLALGINH